jgi:hypothetical protein
VVALAPVAVNVIVVVVLSTPVVGENAKDVGIVYPAAASTKNPCSTAPTCASVVCIDAAKGALTRTYSTFIPLTVGVTENVTTPVAAT